MNESYRRPLQSRTVLISGAGIAGPTLAYWLLQHGFTPTLVERAPALRTGGYMIDFWGVGYDVAERMGLLPTLRRDGYRLGEVRLVDAAGRRIAGFDARVFDAASQGRYFSLLRWDLARRIYELVDGRVETIFGDSVAALHEDVTGVEVTFAHAPPRRFDLVVGADGLHSRVRALTFGDGQPRAGAGDDGDDGDGTAAERYLGYYVAAFSVDDYPHRDEGAYVSYALPGRQAARYALRESRSAFLLVLARDEPLALDPHDAAAQRALLQRCFAGAGWECDEILAAMERAGDFYFDAVAQTRLPTWSRGRIVLLGDAAYCPSLLAGQGSALAMAGAHVLAHALAAAEGDHAAAFAAYERRFKPFVDAKQRAAVRFAGWFAPRTRVGLWLRELATNLLAVPLVGDVMAARSFGDRFELPA
ncbi:MAG TPA: FAD-binding domain [Gemmatimonadaceae bacterium]|nr:FAD-binding domain [Gemmatimonadaceae bacterium]